MELPEVVLSRGQFIKLNLVLTLVGWSFYVTLALLGLAILAAIFINESFVVIGVLLGIFLTYRVLMPLLRALLIGFSMGNRNYFIPRKYSLNDNDLTVTAPNIHETVKWGAFTKWRKISGIHFLYITNSPSYFIPESIVPESDRQELEQLLKSKIVHK
jgi:hypothetical protein